MEDLSKVDANRLYQLLKNVVVGLMLIVLTMALGKMLPEYLSPVLSLGCIAYLYFETTRSRGEGKDSCMYTTYSILLSLIIYTIVTVALTIAFAAGWINDAFPRELLFANSPYVPSLLMMPICAFVCFYMTFRIGKAKVCKQCRSRYGYDIERGRLGLILRHESVFQIRNLTFLFTGLSILVWCYYLFAYVNVSQNSRDWYIFTWVVVIGIFLDQVYFIFRYYNLYLDLHENDQLITTAEMSENVNKTYLRIYVICDGKVLVQDHLKGKYDKSRNHIDTPLVASLPTHNVTEGDVKKVIKNSLDLEGGELRLFYKREYSEYLNQNMNRYFYFLEGTPSDYPQLEGDDRKWLNVKQIKEIYLHDSRTFKRMFIADISRLATIMLTSKTYFENGEKRNKLSSYHPTFDFYEVRNSDLDFNSNKWIHVAANNADSARWRVIKFWRKIFGKNKLNQHHVWL